MKPDIICPYCQSEDTQISSSENNDYVCLECNKIWNNDLLWIHNGFNYFFNNLDNRYRKLNSRDEKEVRKRLDSFAEKYSSSFTIREKDPKSCNNILLNAMEEICEAIAIILSEKLPNNFKHSHEAKMTPYISTIDLEESNDISLFLSVSSKKPRARRISEEAFWHKEENKQWESVEGRYSAMFKDGRYFRSNKWKDFVKEENERIAYVLRYCAIFLVYLMKKDTSPGKPGWAISPSKTLTFISLKDLNDFLPIKSTK